MSTTDDVTSGTTTMPDFEIDPARCATWPTRPWASSSTPAT